ncbi:MAG TPA: hypothetical protein VFE62_06835 [Gemmataceae bacterium]|nr:hypothetical protein [Gemmataceae bacterium]
MAITTSQEFEPAILAADRAAIAARFNADDAIRQAIAPRPQAGIRGGQRRLWLPAPQTVEHGKPKRTGQFTLINESTSVTFDVTETSVKVITKPGHGAFNWLIKRCTMTVEQAREQYRKLLKDGYTEW